MKRSIASRMPWKRSSALRTTVFFLLALAHRGDAAPRLQLPRGGTTLFPDHRIVGFCGTPGAPALGRMTGELAAPTKELLAQADAYSGTKRRKVLPALELIAVVGQGTAGDDGLWRRRVPDEVVDRYLQSARSAKALLLLDIQPGRSDFLTEARHFDRWLREPEVGLALDPEWAMKGKERPGETFGQTSGTMIDSVADYLSKLVRDNGLPEKVLVYHRVTNRVVQDTDRIGSHRGVAIVQSIDGIGSKAAKLRTYRLIADEKPRSVLSGIKLFFDEDTRGGKRLMTPAEVLSLRPEPVYVMYE